MVEPKKVFDVAHPGQSAPSDNARPIIVSRGAPLNDPMVTVSAPKTAPETQPLAAKAVKLEPIKQPESDPEIPADLAPEATITEEATKPEPETAEEKESEIKEPEAEKSEAPAAAEPEATTPQTPVDKAAANEKAKAAEVEAAVAKLEAIEKHIVDKTFFVPIGQSGQAYHGRNRKKHGLALIIIVLLILMALATAYLAVDAGLIKVNVNLPVHVFPQ